MDKPAKTLTVNDRIWWHGAPRQPAEIESTPNVIHVRFVMANQLDAWASFAPDWPVAVDDHCDTSTSSHADRR